MQKMMRAGWAAAAGVAAAVVMAAPAVAAGPTYQTNSPYDCQRQSVCAWQEPEFNGPGVGHMDPEPFQCYSGQVRSLVNRAPGYVLVFRDSQCGYLADRLAPDQLRPMVPAESWIFQPF